MEIRQPSKSEIDGAAALKIGDMVSFQHNDLPEPPASHHRIEAHRIANGYVRSTNAVIRAINDDGTVTLQIGITPDMFADHSFALRPDAKVEGRLFERVPLGGDSRVSNVFRIVQ